MDAAALDAGEPLHVGHHRRERVAIEGVAVQRLGVAHELPALRGRDRGGDRHPRLRGGRLLQPNS